MSNPIHTHGHEKIFWYGRLSALIPSIIFIWIALQVPALATGRPLQISWQWVPSLNVELAFMLDGLSGLFCLIITAIGALVLVYADGYLGNHPNLSKFFVYLHLFLFSMLGLVLSDNLLVLFVFWELTSVFSFLLIGFEHTSQSSRDSARQALLVTGGGGLLLLVGIVLIGLICHTYSLQDLMNQGELLRHNDLYWAIFFCVTAGAFTKSAQFPFHFWLPSAMAAPTPISAFLHSATLVKAGLYLMARFHPILGGTLLWMTTLVVIGAVTAVWGSIVAIGQKDLKRILAHTTILALGIVMMFLGGRTMPALTAAITFLLVHALYKSALFMVVGNIDHQTGTRQIHEIGGLGMHMPFTALAAAMAALSMSGFPLFLGFIGKEIMYKGALTEATYPELAVTAALIANSLMAAVAASIALRPFWGKLRSPSSVTEAAWPMWLGPLVLSGIGLGFGLIPDWVGRWLIQPAVLAFHPTKEIVKLKLFYGFNEPLLLSMATLCLGALIYWKRRVIRAAVLQFTKRLPMTFADCFDLLLQAVAWTASLQTRTLQNGSLFRYLAIIISTILLAVGWALTAFHRFEFAYQATPIRLWQGILILLMLLAIFEVIRSASKLLSICALGVIGAGIALIFLSFGAPDVALTQLLVETLTLIIVAMVLLRLPRLQNAHEPGLAQRLFRFGLAASCGLLVTVLLFMVGQQPVDRTITEFYEKASYVKAHGRNIVNVILVDFRSLDTLGEIIVVAASAIAGLTLVRKRRDER
ncbi:MAG: DUF4040 domain-containing protein [Deltaproteobacteria bacterium]|nr:DUF4040 domain-containing protein [Deltaproteobacteria bacterium]